MSDTTQPQTGGELEELLGSIDADFGYAVGNLNMDTTPESRQDIMEKVNAYILAEMLEIIGDDFDMSKIPFGNAQIEAIVVNRHKAELREAASARFGKGGTA